MKRLILLSIYFIIAGLSNSLPVLGQGSISISSDKTKGCIPELVNFSCSGAPTGSTYLWTIGKDSKTGKSGFGYTFNSPGKYDVSVKITAPNGTVQTVTKKAFISIGEKPEIISFFISRKSLCQKDTVTFTAPASKGMEWDWLIEGVNYKQSSNRINYKFTSYGYQDISLRIKDSMGCVGIKSIDSAVYVAKPPSYDFSASPSPNGCLPFKTTFIPDTSKGSKAARGYTWSFSGGNKTSSTKQFPDTVTYTSAGSYDVSFTIKTIDGCTYNTLKKNYIKVGAGAKLTFSADKLKGVVGDTFRLKGSFISGKQDPNGTFFWETGGAKYGSNLAIKTVYTFPGTYRVVLKYSSNGCDFIIPRDNYLRVYSDKMDTSNSTPTYTGCARVQADFALPKIAGINTKIPVNHSYTRLYRHKWKADSTGATFLPSDTAPNPQITFSYPRAYTITLTARQDTCVKANSQKITLIKSKLDFYSSDRYTTCQPAFVSFNTTSENIDTFYWDFGDGVQLKTTSNHVAHVYRKNSGDSSQGFTVRLSGYSQYGCSASVTKSNYIKVIGPKPDFTLSKIWDAGDSIGIAFKNTSSDVKSFFFDYGDNSHSDSNTIRKHSYTLADTGLALSVYHPAMFVKNDMGCSMTDQARDSIVIFNRPKAMFKAEKIAGCGKFKIAFHNLSRHSEHWNWDFNNDGIVDDTSKNPIHIFEPGAYKINLTSFNNYRKDTFSISNLQVQSKPSIALNFSSRTTCPGQAVKIDAKGVPGNVQNLKWLFDGRAGGSSTDTGHSVVRTFIQPGMHSVLVITTDANGCSDTVSAGSLYLLDTANVPRPEIHYVTSTPNGNRISWGYPNSKDPQKISLYRAEQNFDRLLYTSSGKDDTVFTDNNNIMPGQSYAYKLVSSPLACSHAALESNIHRNISLATEYRNTGEITIKWSAYSGWKVKEYRLYKAKGNGIYSLLASLDTSLLLFTDRRICSELYSYYVEAISAENNFASKSNRSSIQAGAADALPENVQLNYVTVGDDKSIIVEWEPSHLPGVRNYIIDRYTEKSGWQEGYAYTKNTIWKDEYVAVKKEAYIYRIRVQDECGNVSLHSNTGRSILLQAKMDGENIKLDWNKTAAPAGGSAKNYFVQLKTAENQFTTLPQIPKDTSYLDQTDHSAWNGAICYRVMAKGVAGSEDTSSSNVSCVIMPSKLFIPTAFTPNNDGLNDEFKANAAAIYQLTGNTDVDFHLRVYDRWGILVFEATDVTKGWNGMVGDKPAEQGAYTYSIYTVGQDKQHYHVEGTVLLMK